MSGVAFTEEMRGHACFGEGDFARGHAEGRESDTELMFHLTIEIPDAADLAADAPATGWVGCHALGGRREVERGVFNCFVDAADPDARKNMLYRLWFSDGVGRPLTLAGFKVIADGGALDVWPDTSTLYTRVRRGHLEAHEDEGAELVAAGILHIRKRDFARQLTTFRGRGDMRGDRAAALARFNMGFAGQLWDVYGGSGAVRRRRARQVTPG
ncbi:MAG: hypothetical protein WD844_05030 [Thermoleophilaceae bacterium]